MRSGNATYSLYISLYIIIDCDRPNDLIWHLLKPETWKRNQRNETTVRTESDKYRKRTEKLEIDLPSPISKHFLPLTATLKFAEEGLVVKSA